MEPEQFDTMPAFTGEKTAHAQAYLDSLKATLTRGVLALSLDHAPAGSPSFYAAAATLLARLDSRFPANWVHTHIMTYWEMRNTGYGRLEITEIAEFQFATFAKVGRHAYEKL